LLINCTITNVEVDGTIQIDAIDHQTVCPSPGIQNWLYEQKFHMCTTKIIHEQVISKKRRADCLLPHVIHHEPLLTTLSLLWNLVLEIAKPQILLYNPACELTTFLPNTHVCKL
jgi:hypothetical protein